MSIEVYRPTWTLNTIYDINPQMLQKLGITCICTDLDNTLIAWNHPTVNETLQTWVAQMQAANITVIVVSNNNKDRIKKAIQSVQLPFIAAAKKPSAKGIKEALAIYHKSPHETIMVGDQLMTDIKAAYNAGVRSVLVKPLVDSDSWKTAFNRWCERIVRRKLEKKDAFQWKEQLD